MLSRSALRTPLPHHVRVVGATVALAVILVLVIVVPTIIRVRLLQVSEARIRDTAQFATLISKINSAMLDQQTGQRGYIIAADDRFLDTYYSGRDRAAAFWPEAEANAVRLGSTLPALLDETRRVAQIWQAQAADPLVALVQSGERAAAEAIVISGWGKTLFDAYRQAD